MGSFAEAILRGLVISFVIVVGIAVLTLATVSVALTSAVGMLVINAVGGHVTYWMCVLASLASHIVVVGGYVLVDELRCRGR